MIPEVQYLTAMDFIIQNNSVSFLEAKYFIYIYHPQRFEPFGKYVNYYTIKTLYNYYYENSSSASNKAFIR